MKVSDETLMAYVDGELDAETRANVERELAANPDLVLQVDRHRALRRQLQDAFDPIATEPVPEKLLATLQNAGSAPTTDIAAFRERKAARSAKIASPFGWMSIAASIALGVLVGYFSFGGKGPAQIVARDGRVVNPSLISALSKVSSHDAATNDSVAIGISYLAKTGEYCRSFVVGAAQASSQPLAGVACRSTRESWRVRMLMSIDASAGTEYRTAASEIPTSVIELIDREIDGDPLDAQAEATAIAKDWKR